MDKEAINKIESLVLAAAEVKTHEIQGRTFATGHMVEVTEAKYSPCGLTFSDLTSLAKIVNEEKSKFTDGLFIKIDNEATVKVIGKLDAQMERHAPYSSHCDVPQFEFGRWLDYEKFVIGLRSKFVQSDERDGLTKMIASIINVAEQVTEDNGITQEVRTKSGTITKTAEVKSIVKLQPYRTFVECTQPASEFLFRITGNGTQFGLFEADGGRWKMDARRNIKNFLETQIKDKQVVILI